MSLPITARIVGGEEEEQEEDEEEERTKVHVYVQLTSGTSIILLIFVPERFSRFVQIVSNPPISRI